MKMLTERFIMTECTGKMPDFALWMLYIPALVILWGLAAVALKGVWMLLTGRLPGDDY